MNHNIANIIGKYKYKNDHRTIEIKNTNLVIKKERNYITIIHSDGRILRFDLRKIYSFDIVRCKGTTSHKIRIYMLNLSEAWNISFTLKNNSDITIEMIRAQIREIFLEDIVFD